MSSPPEALSSAMPESRNSFVAARQRPFGGFVAVVASAGLILTVQALLRLDLTSGLQPAFWVVCCLLLLAELRPLFVAGNRDVNGLVLSTTFVFALLLRYGLPAALLVQVTATVLSDLTKRRAPWRVAFNVGQYALSWGSAAGMMFLAGHRAGMGSPLDLTGRDLLAAALGAGTFFVVNELLVTRAITLKTGASMRQCLREDLPFDALTSGALLALAPLVCLAMEAGAAFVPLLLPPLVAVYAAASIALGHERQALSDALTGLGNRPLLEQRIRASLGEDGATALVLFDLDRFKEVNDSLGHQVGDRLLQVVAERLTAGVRTVDTVARLGGDEFALVMPKVASEQAAVQTAVRLRTALAAPVVLDGMLLDVGASAGVAVSPEHGKTADVLLEHADVAMYEAKKSGRVEVYDPASDRRAPSRLAMVDELRTALALGQLEVHFQPQIELRTEQVVAVEALVRWRHPHRGLLLPAEFVPLAERSGLVQALTAAVLDQALAALAQWRAAGIARRVAVNLSGRDLTDDRLPSVVHDALRRHVLPGSALQLEVKEGSLLADPGRVAETVARLAALRVDLALDDFGTGNSSLSQLRRLPVRQIKVDGSLVCNLTDPHDLAMVRSALDLARSLNLSVVAEGIQDAQARDCLLALGCDLGQGWFVGPVLPADELTEWFRERAVTPAVGRR